MAELSWFDAIVKVLEQSPAEAMHYTQIAEAILSQGLKAQVGATPARTVSSAISVSIKGDPATPFRRVSAGMYSLGKPGSQTPPPPPKPTSDEDEQKGETGLINAFGMYWARSFVRWTSTPRLLGRQAKGSKEVDFCGQQGVYLLHDRRDVVYVGRTTDQALGVRLRQHIDDRLSGRWERFSWFGIYPVTEIGKLDAKSPVTYDLSSLITTMEALLIEGLEPPQNRKRGDGFKAVEFIQLEDPQIQNEKMLTLVDALKSKLNS